MEEQRKSQLLMFVEHLSDLSLLILPNEYSVRHFREGDEAAWEHIVTEAFGGEHSFVRDMAVHEAYKADRVWFICDSNDVPVATASAWYRPQWQQDTGYLHMVAVVPEHRGHKLGYWISLAALQQMMKDGRICAVLHTDDHRISAIITYLKLGFFPKLADHDHYSRWKEIAIKLGRSITTIAADGSKQDIN